MSDGQKNGQGIWICGEFYGIAGNVKVETYKEKPEWDFKRATAPPGLERDRYWFERRVKTKEGRRAVRDLKEARQATDLLLLHTDGMMTAKGTYTALVNNGASTHFCIDWDGTIIQHLDPGYVCALHGAEQNARSIGIDLNNDLPSLHAEDKGKPYRYNDEMKALIAKDKRYRRRKSPTMAINGRPKRSYGYCDMQYTALVELLKVLCDVFDIPKEFPMNERGEVIDRMLEDPLGFKGFAAHWHTSATRWDPGPGFDWQRVFHALRGEHNSFPVVLNEGENIADLLAPEAVKEAALKLHHNTNSGGGGYFPIGLNQNWHGGIHIHAPKGREVRSMLDGVLVAARFGNKRSRYGDATPLGSNNFLLVRHDIPIPSTKKKKKPKPLRVFSLFMHLGPMEIDSANPAFEWVRQVFRVHKGEEEAKDEALDLGSAEDDPSADAARPDEEITDDWKEVADEDFVPEDEVKPYLEVGYHLAALRSGQVALFDVEDEERYIKIKSGEVIGAVGEFGSGGEMQSLVHCEMFADANWKNAIDMGVHARRWVEIEEDVESNLRVETEDILNLFSTSSNRRKHKSYFRRVHRQVLPQEIIDFFGMPGENEEAKAWLRKSITRHVSEWSDQVDWVRALAESQAWSEKVREFEELLSNRSGGYKVGIFTKEIRKFLPFIWLNAEVAEHIGLKFKGDWNGVVYHFHPLHFLVWLTYHSSSRIKVLSVGKSSRALKKEREVRKKKQELARINGTNPEETEDFHGDDEEWVMELEEDTPEDVLSSFWTRPEPDEWKRPTGEED